MRFTLSSGRRIRIVAEELDGLWEDDRGQISFRSSLKGRALIETLIHELLHAELPKLSEYRVRKTARAVARLMWTVAKRSK
jgi:hypothetical protein